MDYEVMYDMMGELYDERVYGDDMYAMEEASEQGEKPKPKLIARFKQVINWIISKLKRFVARLFGKKEVKEFIKTDNMMQREINWFTSNVKKCTMSTSVLLGRFLAYFSRPQNFYSDDLENKTSDIVAKIDKVQQDHQDHIKKIEDAFDKKYGSHRTSTYFVSDIPDKGVKANVEYVRNLATELIKSLTQYASQFNYERFGLNLQINMCSKACNDLNKIINAFGTLNMYVVSSDGVNPEISKKYERRDSHGRTREERYTQ